MCDEAGASKRARERSNAKSNVHIATQTPKIASAWIVRSLRHGVDVQQHTIFTLECKE